MSFQPSVGRSIPSDCSRLCGHWQLRELAGAYVMAMEDASTCRVSGNRLILIPYRYYPRRSRSSHGDPSALAMRRSADRRLDSGRRPRYAGAWPSRLARASRSSTARSAAGCCGRPGWRRSCDDVRGGDRRVALVPAPAASSRCASAPPCSGPATTAAASPTSRSSSSWSATPSRPARASVTPIAEDVMPSWQARCFTVAIRVLMRRLTWGDDRALARRRVAVFGRRARSSGFGPRRADRHGP